MASSPSRWFGLGLLTRQSQTVRIARSPAIASSARTIRFTLRDDDVSPAGWTVVPVAEATEVGALVALCAGAGAALPTVMTRVATATPRISCRRTAAMAP